MPSTPPPGVPWEADVPWPAEITDRDPGAPLSLYVHVPYCASRCGYCDFNTYTAEELAPGVRRDTYAETARAEIALAGAAIGRAPVTTVFFGGGTPTLLHVADLTLMLGAIREEFDLDEGAEISTEANPDSVDAAALSQLRAAGFNRISFGVQSTAPGVLRTLDRTHTPGRALEAIRAACAAGFDHVSADLIYGTPGETDQDVVASLRAVLDAGVDHVSAYALIVETGTRLAADIGRGVIPIPDDDAAAGRYERIDDELSSAGFEWYELSNWARSGGKCRHNIAYWLGADWWGIGPGAHSHVGGLRWWNVRHPRAHQDRVRAGQAPIEAYERLSADQQYDEMVLLRTRMSDGLPFDRLTEGARESVPDLLADGLVERDPQVVRLTRRGRLLADAVARALT